MKLGKRLVQLWSRGGDDETRVYQIHLPAPQTLENARRHLESLPPHVAERIEVVEVEAVSVRSSADVMREGRDERQTDPAPPMTETGGHCEECGGIYEHTPVCSQATEDERAAE